MADRWRQEFQDALLRSSHDIGFRCRKRVISASNTTRSPPERVTAKDAPPVGGFRSQQPPMIFTAKITRFCLPAERFRYAVSLMADRKLDMRLAFQYYLQSSQYTVGAATHIAQHVHRNTEELVDLATDHHAIIPGLEVGLRSMSVDEVALIEVPDEMMVSTTEHTFFLINLRDAAVGVPLGSIRGASMATKFVQKGGTGEYPTYESLVTLAVQETDLRAGVKGPLSMREFEIGGVRSDSLFDAVALSMARGEVAKVFAGERELFCILKEMAAPQASFFSHAYDSSSPGSRDAGAHRQDGLPDYCGTEVCRLLPSDRVAAARLRCIEAEDLFSRGFVDKAARKCISVRRILCALPAIDDPQFVADVLREFSIASALLGRAFMSAIASTSHTRSIAPLKRTKLRRTPGVDLALRTPDVTNAAATEDSLSMYTVPNMQQVFVQANDADSTYVTSSLATRICEQNRKESCIATMFVFSGRLPSWIGNRRVHVSAETDPDVRDESELTKRYIAVFDTNSPVSSLSSQGCVIAAEILATESINAADAAVNRIASISGENGVTVPVDGWLLRAQVHREKKEFEEARNAIELAERRLEGQMLGSQERRSPCPRASGVSDADLDHEKQLLCEALEVLTQDSF